MANVFATPVSYCGAIQSDIWRTALLHHIRFRVSHTTVDGKDTKRCAKWIRKQGEGQIVRGEVLLYEFQVLEIGGEKPSDP